MRTVYCYVPDLVKWVPVLVQEQSLVVGRLVEGHHQLIFCQVFSVPAARRGHQENSSPLVQAPHRSIVVGWMSFYLITINEF